MPSSYNVNEDIVYLRVATKIARRTRSRSIDESKLRRMIRDELSRQVLMQEGVWDKIKAPFKKLSDKAKAWVLEKAKEMAAKASEAVGKLQLPEGMKEFIDAIPQQEGGVSRDELVKMVPGLAEGAQGIEVLKQVELKDAVAEGPVATAEAYTFDAMRTAVMLSEEMHLQRPQPALEPLNESVLLSALGVWYTFSKTVVTTLGLLIFVLEAAEKVCKYLKLEKAKKVLAKIVHFLEKVEKWFIEKAIFPAPVQYAAYLALAGGKKAVGKTGGEKVLSFKEFHDPKNKQTRENVVKGLKIALLCVIVVEALVHLFHTITEFFHNIGKSVQDLAHAGEHAGLETRNIAKTGGEIAKTGGEIGKAAAETGKVVGAVQAI